MASLPIFFIHQGDHFYLRCSLLQARQFNPKAQIFVLGDRRAKRIVDAMNPQAKIEFAFLHHYLPAAQDKEYNIGRYYFHISPNRYEYELFCIQRWFILDKFLHQHGIDKAFYQDSDVLLFTEIRPDLRVFSADAAGLLAHASQCCSSLHTSYFIRDVLHDFCGFILDVYKNNRRLLEEYIEETGCHISDMSLAKLYFSKVQTSNIMNLQDPVQERDEPLPTLFDVTIRSVEDFASCCHHKIQVKAIAWENNAHFSQGGGQISHHYDKIEGKKTQLAQLTFPRRQ